MSVATTYAEALYEAAVSRDAVARVASDLGDFRAALAESSELRTALTSPEIDTRAKKKAVAALIGDADELVGSFLQVLLDRRRIGELDAIAEAFAEQVGRAEGRMSVRAITAIPLSEELRGRIVERVQSQTGRAVDLVEAVDPEMLGGLVLEVGGARVDGSVRQRLADLRLALRRVPIESATTAS